MPSSPSFLTGDDGELGIGVSRYGDLSSNSCVRQMTFVGLESNYYPVGPKGIAPYASSALGLARVTDQDVGFLGICSSAAPTSEIGLGFGLGVRLNLGPQATALVEGRFFQVPNSAIQALEGRANVSIAFGSSRKTELLNGTLGPAVGILTRLGGSLEGRGPTLGVRFRRDTKKAGSIGLQIDYAPLRVSNCTSTCEPAAVLFAPGYEPSLRPSWGRLYFDLGFLLAGFPSPGSDRGPRMVRARASSARLRRADSAAAPPRRARRVGARRAGRLPARASAADGQRQRRDRSIRARDVRGQLRFAPR